MAFAPRDLELRVEAAAAGDGSRAEIRADALLAGATSMRIRRVVER
jgi:hypothetical protein